MNGITQNVAFLLLLLLFWSKLTLFFRFTSSGGGNKIGTYKKDTDIGLN